jgi:tetrahydromethanopterin S-methyltransferase subunit G
MTQEIGLREVFEQVNARLASMETRLENLRQEMQGEFASVRREIATNFLWTVGILIGILLPSGSPSSWPLSTEAEERLW